MRSATTRKGRVRVRTETGAAMGHPAAADPSAADSPAADGGDCGWRRSSGLGRMPWRIAQGCVP